MSENNGGDFMAEMAAFLRPLDDGGEMNFQAKLQFSYKDK